MPRFFKPLFLLLARLSDRQLANVVQYLKTENEILRARLPERLVVTPKERQRLMKFGRPLGSKIKEFISIVSPSTFLRWLREERVGKHARKPKRAPGRPRTDNDLRDLVLRLARENGWGYTRILGELMKLGLGNICRSTVVNILKEAGLDPGPLRGEGTWDDFIHRHMATLWACDFFSVRSWTIGGMVDLYVVFFIHVDSRRVIVSGVSANPDDIWMKQQARNMAIQWGDETVAPRYLIHDRDTKFTAGFKAILRSEGVEMVPTCAKAPNMNPYAERFVQTVKTECLDHFVFFGDKHLQHVLDEWIPHYNRQRPHQSKGNVPLPVADLPELPILPFPAKIECDQKLGGLIKHYRRAA